MKTALHLPYLHQQEEKINRLQTFFQGIKKVVIGLLFYCGLELLFVGITGAALWFILHAVSEALKSCNKPSEVFNDTSFRWIVSGYAGLKNRKRVKIFLERNFKIILH